MRTTGRMLSSLMAAALMATAGAGAIPVAPQTRKESRVVSHAIPKGRGKGPAKRREPVTQEDRLRVQLAKEKRQRKADKFLSDQARSAAGQRERAEYRAFFADGAGKQIEKAVREHVR